MSPGVRLGELDHDPDQLRGAGRDLLSRPPYSQDAEGLLPRAMRWLREGVAELLDGVWGLFVGDVVWAWAVVGIGVVLLAIAVWRATRGLTLDPAGDLPPAAPDSRRDPATWAADAEAHEAAGRWAQAVRCRYLSVVGWLVDGGFVDDADGRTVGELDREVARRAPDLLDGVTEAGAIFAEVFYGRRPASLADARRVAEVAEEVRAAQRRAVTAVGR